MTKPSFSGSIETPFDKRWIQNGAVDRTILDAAYNSLALAVHQLARHSDGFHLAGDRLTYTITLDPTAGD